MGAPRWCLRASRRRASVPTSSPTWPSRGEGVLLKSLILVVLCALPSRWASLELAKAGPCLAHGAVHRGPRALLDPDGALDEQRDGPFCSIRPANAGRFFRQTATIHV